MTLAMMAASALNAQDELALSTSEFFDLTLTNHTPIFLEGVIRDVFSDDIDTGYRFLILDGPSNSVYITCATENCSMADLRKLVGSHVAVHGRVNIAKARGRQYIPRMLSINRLGDIETLTRRTQDPFDVPRLVIHPSANPSNILSTEPRKISGTVIALWNQRSALITTEENTPVEAEFVDSDIPAVGDTIEAVGLPETDLIHLKLTRTDWKPVTISSPIQEAPLDVRLKELFVARDGRFITSTSRYGKLLKVRGTIKGVILDRNGQRSLLLEEDGYTIPINCSAMPDLIDRISEGCRVELTGVCIIEFENWQPDSVFPHLRGIFLVLRTESDLTVLATPPWLTPFRFGLILSALIVIIVAILIWNASLRIMVARKSRALLREQVEKLKESMKLDERTRLAAELHDYLAQNLTVISYQVSAAESAMATGSDEALALLKTADKMLQSSRIDLRRCLWDLKNNALNEPNLAEAVRRTVLPVLGNAELAVRFDIRRTRIDDSTAHTILSICRELTANAVRHGQAANIRIAGECVDGRLRFSVRDNGCGFDPDCRPGQTDGHFGLDGVQERIKRFGGTLTIESTPGKGSRFVIIIPLRQPLT